MIALTAAQMREVEQAAIQNGLDSLRLMENAGSAAAKLIRLHYAVNDAAKEQSIVILCGNGNNGGDGFVIARKLMDEGAQVTVILTAGLPRTEDAMEMYYRIQQTTVKIVSLMTEPYIASACVRNAYLIIDAVYGIGFRDQLPAHLHGFFRTVNDCVAPLIAVDIPSGMYADTGASDPHALKADMTITFTANKAGMTTPAGLSLCGKVLVAPIGIDESLLSQYAVEYKDIHGDMVQPCFAQRRLDSNKGDFGRLLIVCGSRGMAGASMMATQAALRCGVGLAVSALPRSLYPLAASRLWEPVYHLMDETGDGEIALTAVDGLLEPLGKATACLIGCGLGTSPGAKSLVLGCLESASCPLVLDADGINLISSHINTLKTARNPLILTPHPGEMARMTGLSVVDIQANRMEITQRFADEYGVILVLKGYRTVIASPGEIPLVNTTGNPGMAKGGSGDVLAGMIASFLAQGMPARDAAMCGVYLHGLAGDLAAARLSQRAMQPTDMINELGELFLNLEK